MSESVKRLGTRIRYIRELNSTFGVFDTNYRHLHKQLAMLKASPQTVETQNKCTELEAELIERISTWKQEQKRLRENI